MSEAYLSCPSAQPDQADARVIGVVTGDPTAPRIAYLDRDVSVTEADLELPEGVRPTRVLRFAGRCESASCGQFRNGGCRLGRDVAAMLAPVDQNPPACSIRRTCRWFAENGPSVCLRCSRVVTEPVPDDRALLEIAADARKLSRTGGSPPAHSGA